MRRRGATACGLARLGGAALIAGTLVTAVGLAAAPAVADSSDQVVTVDIPPPKPTLRWGINPESTSGAYVGGCNFLMAGKAGDRGKSAVWTEADGLYRASEGTVRIERPTASGWEQARWDTRCLDAAGKPVSVQSTRSFTGSQVVMSDGTVTAGADGSTTIAWRGSFTLVFYGGMTYWSATDPVLRVEPGGSATLTAILSGYGANRDDVSAWSQLPNRQVRLATFESFPLGPGGGTATPDYLGVTASGPGLAQVARTEVNGPFWGAFPAGFLDYQQLTGQSSYWYTSGGSRDPAKPPLPLTVSYTGTAPEPVLPTPQPTESAGPAVVPPILASGSGARPAAAVSRRAPGPAAVRPLGVVAPPALAAPALALAPGGPSETLWRTEPLVPQGPATLAHTGSAAWAWWTAAALLAASAGLLLARMRQGRHALLGARAGGPSTVAGTATPSRGVSGE